MAILTTQQKSMLLAAAPPGMSDADAATFLSTRTMVPNPEPTGTTLKTFTYSDVMGLLSTDSLIGIRNSSLLPRILDDINSLNRPGVASWAGLLVSSSSGVPPIITTQEYANIVGLMNATVPDPSYRNTVPSGSWAETNFSDIVFTLPNGITVVNQITQEMVHESRN